VACVFLVEENLALQVAQFNHVAIDDPDRADAGADQGIGRRASQRAAAAHQRMALQKPSLSFLAQRRVAHLTQVTIY
jgi:hypothetical protein